ncbi:hypothetical protein CLM83_14705, partial [Streptomyces albidoflavus]
STALTLDQLPAREELRRESGSAAGQPVARTDDGILDWSEQRAAAVSAEASGWCAQRSRTDRQRGWMVTGERGRCEGRGDLARPAVRGCGSALVRASPGHQRS